MNAAARKDPAAFGPGVQLRYQRELEPPDADEGFSASRRSPSRARSEPAEPNRAVFVWYDGVLRTTARVRGARRPPDDVVVRPGRAEMLRRRREERLSAAVAGRTRRSRRVAM